MTTEMFLFEFSYPTVVNSQDETYTYETVKKMMKDYATHHVKEALKAVKEIGETKLDYLGNYGNLQGSHIVPESIDAAYPLSNIQ